MRLADIAPLDSYSEQEQQEEVCILSFSFMVAFFHAVMGEAQDDKGR
mgnify:CR=1 FL=1